MKQAVLSLSGGMDSSSLLLLLLAQGYQVTALSFDYGQKHKVELERATELVSYLNGCCEKTSGGYPNELQINHNFHPVKHQIIKLDGLSQLLNSSLVEGGSDIPEGHYEQDNMKETVVPNRNKIFSSIIQAVALSIANKTGEECIIALGIHKGDESVYPDCRAEFRNADLKAFQLGNWDSELVSYYTPYIDVMKYDILKDGLENCQKLGLDFNEVYKRTNTSYKPIFLQDRLQSNPKVGKWFSDYKSASSVERIEAFIKLGRPDPVEYANIEDGPVSWDVARTHVENILEKWKNK